MGASVGGTGRVKQTTIDGVLTVATHDAVAAVLYLIALAALYRFSHKYTAVVLVLSGAVAGQFLFV
jgi:hypothetical protein